MGKFLFEIILPAKFPLEKPILKFLTPIFHPYINYNYCEKEGTLSGTGAVCIEFNHQRKNGLQWNPYDDSLAKGH